MSPQDVALLKLHLDDPQNFRFIFRFCQICQHTISPFSFSLCSYQELNTTLAPNCYQERDIIVFTGQLLCPQHHLVWVTCTRVALQKSASWSDHLADRQWGEAQPRPDWNGEGDIGKNSSLLLDLGNTCRWLHACYSLRQMNSNLILKALVDHDVMRLFICQLKEKLFSLN